MARFRFDVHRERFALRRGAMRTILGSYLGLGPSEIRFRYSAKGKPEIESAPEAAGPKFNLSDSEDLAILGVTPDADIGVDVEQRRPTRDLDALARRYFSEREQAEYFDLPESQRVEGFYSCWTRKEALLKATGEGITVDLKGFDVTLAPGRPAELLEMRSPPGEAGMWRLYALEPRRGFAAAVAVPSRSLRLRPIDHG